jgi:hypothetical protein
VVGADDEVGGDGGAVGAGSEVGDVALDPGQGPGFGLQFAVDALHGSVEGDEPVPLDGRQPGDGTHAASLINVRTAASCPTLY